jgi:hypothetical protein
VHCLGITRLLLECYISSTIYSSESNGVLRLIHMFFFLWRPPAVTKIGWSRPRVDLLVLHDLSRLVLLAVWSGPYAEHVGCHCVRERTCRLYKLASNRFFRLIYKIYSEFPLLMQTYATLI